MEERGTPDRVQTQKAHRRRKQRGATWGVHNDIAQACRDGAGKTRADLELKLELS